MISAPSNPWKLGLFVVLSVALALSAVVYLGAARLDRRTFEAITLIDESVQGLDVGAPVKFRGVTIGKVTAIEFAPDRRHVVVLVQVYLDVLEDLGLANPAEPNPSELAFVEQGVRLQLSRSGITGITFLEADVFPPELYPVPEYSFRPSLPLIPSVPSRLKGLEDGLTDALSTLPDLLANTNQLVVRLDRTLSELDPAGVGRRVERLLEGVDARVRAVDPASLARASADLETALSELRALLADLRAPEGPLGGTLGAARELISELDRALLELEPAATGRSLRRAGDALARVADAGVRGAERLEVDLSAMREALERVRALAELLERDPGALLRGRAPSDR